jgi:hypothetical protein
VPAAGDNFGSSVAVRLAGGAQTEHVLVVGAPYEDGGSVGVTPGGRGGADDAVSDAGVVYAVALDGSVTAATFAAYIKASTIGAGDRFGAAIALTRDSLVVGAPGTGAQVGAVYTFR